jgi:plastocyanin
LRSLVPPAFSRRASGVVAGVVAALVISAGSVTPALAHDSAAGRPAVTITIGSSLSHRDVRVSAGDIVRFVNRDDERHRMRSRSGEGFDTGDLEPGDAYQVRLSSAGTYSYLDERNDEAGAYRGRIVVVSGVGSASGGSAGESTGGESAGGSTGGGSAGGSASGSTGGSVPSSATVTIGDDFYQPTSVRVAAGGTVTFRNTGGDEHSATSASFDTGVLGGGASARETFAAAGTFSFLCIFHSDMRGTIEVVAPGDTGTGAPDAPRPTPTPAPSPVPAPTAVPTPPLGGAPSAVSVDAADFEFRPATIEVAAGGRVTWTNRGVAPHTVTAEDGTFDSGMLEAGAAFTQAFEAPGSYAYLCAFHPEMTAAIRVVAATSRSAIGGTAAAGTPADRSAGTPGGTTPTARSGSTASPTPSIEPAAIATTAGRGAATDVSNLAGLALAVTLVSAAAALFSRAIRGTVHDGGWRG